jgi:MFS family permease
VAITTVRRWRAAADNGVYRHHPRAASLGALPRSVGSAPVIAVAISATLFTATQGLTYPLLAFVLEQHGSSSWAVGVNAAMMPLGMIAAAPAAAPLIGRWGSLRVATVSLACSALCLLAIGAFERPGVWLALRFGIGFLLTLAFVVTDTWMNRLAPDHWRGRVLGLYCAMLSIGFTGGPALLVLMGTRGALPFLVGASLLLLSLLPLRSVSGHLRDTKHEPHVSIRAFARRGPSLMLAVGAAAFGDQAAMSLLPVYGHAVGLSTRAATLALLAMLLGSIILLYPIGLLADRLDRRTVTAGCAAATAALFALLPASASAPIVLMTVLFASGGACYAIYALSLAALGERHADGALLAGNAALGAMWGLGGSLGAPVTGGAMRAIGPSGFPITLAVVFGALALALALALARTVGDRRPDRARRSG